MRRSLTLHPDSTCTVVTGIEVEAARTDRNLLTLRYALTGKIDALKLPSMVSPTRSDELWRTTCFEAFLRTADSAAYYELNFAPSTEWAAYRFSDYREGMAVATVVETPRIELRTTDAIFELQASLSLHDLPGLPSDRPWHLGLSAVIEEANGQLSYWALAHPPGKPNFHHSDCFAWVLPVAGQP